jgi:hypothetical protein
MKKLLIFFALIGGPYYLKAQDLGQNNISGEFRPGLIKKDIRAVFHRQSPHYEVILETDTIDSYSLNGIYRINCYYNKDICYKTQMIVPFDHTKIKVLDKNSYQKKIGKNTWLLSSSSGIERKITVDESKDLATMEFTLLDPKRGK